MTDTNVFQLSQPGTFADPLTEVLRNGARALLAQAVEAEIAALLSSHADKLTEDGRQRVVRHGHLPEREIMTGIGPVAVRSLRRVGALIWSMAATRVDTANWPWPTKLPRGQGYLGRAARGSVAPRKMACRFAQ